MKLEIDGKLYDLHIEHKTEVSLRNGDDYILGGVAYCRSTDVFSKSKGAKEAFRRAIAHLPRQARRLLWAQISRKPGKTAALLRPDTHWGEEEV